MRLTFYLPTKENWCGTFEGGYVECVFINERQPTSVIGEWEYFIFIIFQGNDDLMWAKRYEIAENKRDEETVKALELIANIPLPVTKDYLKTIGFEVE